MCFNVTNHTLHFRIDVVQFIHVVLHKTVKQYLNWGGFKMYEFGVWLMDTQAVRNQLIIITPTVCVCRRWATARAWVRSQLCCWSTWMKRTPSGLWSNYCLGRSMPCMVTHFYGQKNTYCTLTANVHQMRLRWLPETNCCHCSWCADTTGRVTATSHLLFFPSQHADKTSFSSD